MQSNIKQNNDTKKSKIRLLKNVKIVVDILIHEKIHI